MPSLLARLKHFVAPPQRKPEPSSSISSTASSSPQPSAPLQFQIPPAIIAATEKGMVSEGASPGNWSLDSGVEQTGDTRRSWEGVGEEGERHVRWKGRDA